MIGIAHNGPGHYFNNSTVLTMQNIFTIIQSIKDFPTAQGLLPYINITSKYSGVQLKNELLDF